MDLHVWSYPDVVIYSKFHRNPFSVFEPRGGVEIYQLPLLWQAIGFYNSLHGNSLHYRASRDCVANCWNLTDFLTTEAELLQWVSMVM